MGKEQSPQTEIRNLRREVRRLRDDLAREKTTAEAYRRRATIAEQDAAEWRRRFDSLLSKCGIEKEPSRD